MECVKLCFLFSIMNLRALMSMFWDIFPILILFVCEASVNVT